MLGILRPKPGLLDAAAHARYRRLYCGLCAALGHDQGLILRAIHTYDGVFLALVGDGIGPPAKDGLTRCPLAPHTTRAVVDPDSPALRYAAAVQMLALDQRFADDAAEGSRLATALRALISPRIDRIVNAPQSEQRLPAPTALRRLSERQSTVEAAWPSAAHAAEPTAGALSDVFAQLAPLSPAPDAAENLAAFGHALGQIIYLIDALEDLRGDHHSARFNPCLTATGQLDVDRTMHARDALIDAHARLVPLLARLPLRRHRDLADTIIDDELSQRIGACVRTAEHWVSDKRRALERRANLGLVGLTSDRLLVACVTIWVVLTVTAPAARAAPRLVPHTNHFCHADCVKPSTYCGFGYPHDGRFAMDDCASRWASGLGKRVDQTDDVGSAARVLCPSDTTSYCLGECACCADGGNQGRGCCGDLPGWCIDIWGLFSWVASIFAVAWTIAETRVDRTILS